MRGLFDEGPRREVEQAQTLQVVAGIDEAGLGPMLGPLTLGWSALRYRSAPPPEAALAPWRLLASAVLDAPPGRSQAARARLFVADSKLVFDRSPEGHRRLERTALAFFQAGRGLPLREGRQLLATGSGRLETPAAIVARHPWYQKLGALPRWCEVPQLERDGRLLLSSLEEAGIEGAGSGVRVIPAGELNDSFARTGNKSATVWLHCSGIIEHLFEQHGAEGLDLVVDRQGGRSHYEALLRADLPGARVRTLREGKGGCEYWVVSGPRRMRLRIVERAERASFCVAVASCLAKYAREVCMAAFNDYFAQFQADLRPTAGYVTDGRRWLEEASVAFATCKVAAGLLIRER